MTLPIIAYGNSILRKSGLEVIRKDKKLEVLLESLWITLESSGGVGLAAPQINDNNKVFIVNSKLMYDDLNISRRKTLFSGGDEGIVESFINARIIAESEDTWNDREACLSIPGISEHVERAWEIIVEYKDQSFKLQRKQFAGYTARVIQHEYDHTKGVLFIDYLTALRKKILNKKLKLIKAGKIRTDYQIKYLNHKKCYNI